MEMHVMAGCSPKWTTDSSIVGDGGHGIVEGFQFVRFVRGWRLQSGAGQARVAGRRREGGR